MNWCAVRPPAERAQPVKVSPRTVAHLKAGEAGHRVRIPAEIHPYSAGVKGGVVGGVVMAIVACAYGLIAYHSIWYPINLLAAAALPSMAQADLAQLKAFNGTAFVVALLSHGAISLLVGLLFAVLLPMLPSRRAAFWGSLMAPLLWSALVWATLRLVNPALNARIDWGWFIASQVAFGLVTGYVVHHTKTVETMQTWPLAARAGLEAPGSRCPRKERSNDYEALRRGRVPGVWSPSAWPQAATACPASPRKPNAGWRQRRSPISISSTRRTAPGVTGRTGAWRGAPVE